MELKNGTALKGGEYLIKRKLGQGGMGITYLATMRVEVQRGLGTVTTQADVVVKEFFIGDYCERGSDTHTVTVISQRFNDAVAAGLKKFGKEARNLSTMNHPNIVHVIDLFSENQTEYIVMDYLPGGSLRDYVENHGVLSSADATQRIAEVARALAFIHGQHLCHFDVKPGNVMLGANGEAVLIDFGLSKRYGADDRHTSSLLYMGVSEGFAPLEQYTDSVANFSPQTDVYALGATLYYLLTGKAPGKASYNIKNVLSDKRPANIPENLWQLILHSMQPNPEDRPADAAEFLRLLNGEIVKTPPPPPSPHPPVTPPSPPSTGGETEINVDSSGNKYLKYGLVAAIVAAVLFLGTWLVNHFKEEQSNIVKEFPSTPQPTSEKETFTVNGVSFNMIKVEGGTFTMGATSEQDEPEDDESPTHEVSLSSYLIGETEVTQELWEVVMGSNPSVFTGHNRPVENVSWDDCQEFIKKLDGLTGKKFRLPTEAEWEFAARGGNKSNHTQYAGSDNLNDVAWYFGHSNGVSHDVATKSPNELGLYDMSGNVWEWCQDLYGDYRSSAQTNPTGPSSGSDRVLRGGSWYNGARHCRVSLRSCPSDRNDGYGLRLAL